MNQAAAGISRSAAACFIMGNTLKQSIPHDKKPPADAQLAARKIALRFRSRAESAQAHSL